MNIQGALWIATDRDSGEPRKDKNGNKFFNGNIDIDGAQHKVVAFINKPKDNPRAPDIKIMLSNKKGTTRTASPEPEHKTDEFEDDEIPF